MGRGFTHCLALNRWYSAVKQSVQCGRVIEDGGNFQHPDAFALLRW